MVASPPGAQAQVVQCLQGGHQLNCSGTAALFAATNPAVPSVVTLRGIVASDLPNLAGNVTGPYGATVVVALQNVPISAVAPLGGQVLGYNGAAWIPTTLASLPPSGAAGGDLGGTYPNPTVTGFRSVPLFASAPANGQAWVYASGTSDYRLTNIVTATGPGSNQIVAVTDSAASACQVARRVTANAHVEVAVGTAAADSDNVIGVYAASYAAGAQATIVKSGGIASCGVLSAGPLYRSATGSLVLYSALAVNDFTVRVGSSSNAGAVFDVLVGEGQQVAP